MLANNRGVELLKAGDLEGALEVFEHCLKERPASRTFEINLSETPLEEMIVYGLSAYGLFALVRDGGWLQTAFLSIGL